MSCSIHSESISRYDNDVAITITLQSNLMMAKNMLVNVSNELMAINGRLNLILFAIIGGLYIRLFFKYSNKLRIARSVFLFLLLLGPFILISYFFHPNLFSYSLVIQAMYLFAVNSLPVLILFPQMKSVDILLKHFYKASFVLFFIVVLCVPLFLANKNTGLIVDYSMSYGQAAMIPCMFLYSKFFKDKDIKALVLAIVATLCVFTIGSRFPLLCIGVFVIIKLIQRIKESRFKLLLLLVPIIFALLFIYQEYVLTAAYQLLASFGIQSRTLRLLASGKLMNDSGRSEIHKIVYEALKRSPIFGYGFGGGYIVVNGMTHSLVLDIFCNLGIPVGFAFMCWFCFQYVDRIHINKIDYPFVELMLIFGCVFLPKAFLGGELWETDKFWWVIALIIMDKNRKRRRKEEYENPICDRIVERTSYNSL